MRTTTLGASGPAVSRIGLGLAALGRPGYINLGHDDDLDGGLDVDAMEARAHAVLDAAWAAGVRYFDAARSYGRAEAFLASWLARRGIEPGAAVVGSKWGYTYTAGWLVEADRHEVKDHSPATLDRQLAETRDTLGDHLDLYQVHSATLESGVLDDRAVLERLARFREEGRRVGVSVTGPRQGETIDRALAVEVDGRPLFDAVQATWNLLEPSAGPALARAHAAGLGVIVKEALANGRLAGRSVREGLFAGIVLLAEEAERLKVQPDALAMAVALAMPWADVVLSGAATVEQLRSNLGAEAVPRDEPAEWAMRALAEPPETYWATRSRLPWN